MELLIWFVAWGVVCGAVAVNRGRSFFSWFLIGALISPLALIVLFSKENLHETEKIKQAEASRQEALRAKEAAMALDLRDCPFCAERIKRQAKLCRFCGKEVEPATDNPAGRSPQSPFEWRR